MKGTLRNIVILVASLDLAYFGVEFGVAIPRPREKAATDPAAAGVPDPVGSAVLCYKSYLLGQRSTSVFEHQFARRRKFSIMRPDN